MCSRCSCEALPDSQRRPILNELMLASDGEPSLNFMLKFQTFSHHLPSGDREQSIVGRQRGAGGSLLLCIIGHKKTHQLLSGPNTHTQIHVLLAS